MAPHTNIISSFDELQKVSKTTVNLLCEELSRKGVRIDDDDCIFVLLTFQDANTLELAYQESFVNPIILKAFEDMSDNIMER
ncbi:unnamed protein product [Rhizophagus irregularis]|nr:unnamed protein product [Rhizophagus irregularis]